MSTQINRLPAGFGSLVDRSQPVSFSFAGRAFRGYAGDTLASALAANDWWLLSRSFKYRRPRGILTMAGQDANTLVQVGDEPNVLADRRLIHEGMAADGQNYDGGLENDRGNWVEAVSRFMPAGFYYKAFYKKGSWKRWEPYIRRKAGLGRVNLRSHHGYFDKAYLFADVAVIGGGPAGLAAALQAARGGAEVVLIDENTRLGGSLSYARFEFEERSAVAEARALVEAVAEEPNIRILTDAACTGWFADNWLPVIRGPRLYKLRAKALVVATGSLEQPAVFRNNDLPGVMLGTAAQRLIRSYGVRPGRSAVVLTANADGYGVALDLQDAGVEVRAIVDLRSGPGDREVRGAAQARDLKVLPGHTIAQATPSLGKRRVDSVLVSPITGEGIYDTSAEQIDCELVCMSVGYTPAAHLLHHARSRFAYDPAAHIFAPVQVPAHIFPAGSVNGVYELSAVLADGRRAGWAAARDAGLGGGVLQPWVPDHRGAAGQNHPWPIFPHRKGRDFVDFDEDLQVHDLLDGAEEGYDDIELLKRYTTVGMGPSQGRHSAVNAAKILARWDGRPLSDIQVTTQRPPVYPEKFGHLAGRGFEPERHTAMHHRHLELGAQMMPAGLWLRPAYYGEPGNRAQAIRDEVLAVRTNVGVIDVSTLGGLDVRGPDAAEFLNRIYTFSYTKLPIERSRYVLMTDQTGAVVDDGVACRLRDELFYVTATTSGVDAVYRQMLFWNAQWRLNVDIANVTAAFAAVNLAGPRSREVLEKLCDDLDVSAKGFPYLAVRTGTVARVPARILRVGFVGELGYEIHVPASMGEYVWDQLLWAGASLGIKPFGVEAQRVLRLEKGHIIVGQDTDGLTHPYEADMAWAMARNKPFHLGGRSVEIQNARGLTRKLVGFMVEATTAPVPEECHLVVRGAEIVGRVTSAVRSPSLNRTIGLAYVAPDQAAVGQEFDIKVGGGFLVRARVVPIPFYDPENKRQEL